MTTLGIVIGSATAPGRLHRAAIESAAWVHDAGGIDTTVIDLSAVSLDVADGRPDDDYGPATRNAVDSLRHADGVVVFSPTYRASIPGALKNLFDLAPVAALSAKPVGIVAMGGSDHHYLGVDRTCGTSSRSSVPWWRRPASTSPARTSSTANRYPAPSRRSTPGAHHRHARGASARHRAPTRTTGGEGMVTAPAGRPPLLKEST